MYQGLSLFLIDEEYQEMIIQKKVFHPLGNLLTTSIFFFSKKACKWLASVQHCLIIKVIQKTEW